MIRSITAILVGYIAMFVATMFFFFAILYPMGLSGEETMGIILIYVLDFITAVFGGYLTGYIARRHEIRHALFLIAFALVIGIVSMVTMPEDKMGTIWYHIGQLAIMVVGVFTGGWIRQIQNIETNAVTPAE